MTEAPDPEAAQAAIEYCYAQGWSDGLPLVPASQPLVDKFLATTTRAPDEVIGELEQVGRNCTMYLVVFCPEHAQMLAAAGYANPDVQAWLMEHCGRTGADLRRAGKNGLRGP